MSRRTSSRRGTVLILVLVVITILSLAAYTFSELMFAEEEAATLHGRQVQAQLLAESGLVAARQFLAQELETQRDQGGQYDNPDRFQGVLVLDDEAPEERGQFTLVSPRVEEGVATGIRYGLEDESARLNLHLVLAADEAEEGGGREMLMGLPAMTEEIADAILDWMDEDEEPREFGAELDEYSSLDPPYAPQNGPPDTIEELLLVRGVTPWLLFGADGNRSGVLDPHEQPSAQAAGLESYNGELDCGWSSCLTLFSKESNLNPEGEPRIDLNQEDMNELKTALEEHFDAAQVAFILAYRLHGPDEGENGGGQGGGQQGGGQQGGGQQGGGQQGGGQQGGGQQGGGQQGGEEESTQLTSVLDLMGAKVRVPGQTAAVLESPFPDDPQSMEDYLPELLDYLTVHPAEAIAGRININQAPRAVLRCIPGMTDDLVENIIAQRDPETANDEPSRQHETWILQEGIVKLDEMKKLLPYITTRGSVYRVQSIGYFEASGPSARVEALIDASDTVPRQLFWRNLTHLGRGYPLETLGVSTSE